jgi:hypothetical protein
MAIYTAVSGTEPNNLQGSTPRTSDFFNVNDDGALVCFNSSFVELLYLTVEQEPQLGEDEEEDKVGYCRMSGDRRCGRCCSGYRVGQ